MKTFVKKMYTYKLSGIPQDSLRANYNKKESYDNDNEKLFNRGTFHPLLVRFFMFCQGGITDRYDCDTDDKRK